MYILKFFKLLDKHHYLYLECFENNKTGGESDVVIGNEALIGNGTAFDRLLVGTAFKKTRCREKCQEEDFCDAFIITENDFGPYECSLNTFDIGDEITNSNGKIFGLKHCAGKIQYGHKVRFSLLKKPYLVR